MYTRLCTIYKVEYSVSILLQIRQKHLKLMGLFSILYLSLYDMAKIFKSGTERLSDII